MCRYLANKYPEKGLGGTDAKSRALVDNWMEAEAQNLDPYTGVRQKLWLQPSKSGHRFTLLYNFAVSSTLGNAGSGCSAWPAADCVVEAAALLQGLAKQRVFVPMFGGTPDEAKVKDALEGLEKTLQVLDQRLAANKYLAGGRCAFPVALHLHRECLALAWAS